MRIVVLCKRQYTNKDAIDDRYGRLWEIPAALARLGHTVSIVCLSYQARARNEEKYVVEGGGSVHWRSVNLGTLVVTGFIKYLSLVRSTIEVEQPDIIWSASDSIYSILGEHYARRSGCRVVTDLYDNFEYFAAYRVPIVRSRFRRAVRESDGVSCVSAALQRHIQGSYGRSKPSAVVTNAVDTTIFKPMDKVACREKLGLPSSGRLVGAAGDISDYRGTDTLYQAFVNHGEELEGVKLAVAGYRNKDTRIPAASNIIDMGKLPPGEVPVFLNCLDLAIIYNRSSTFGDYCFPQKFYEAVACDLPVVVAKVGELGDLLSDQPQLFYADGDSTELVKAIKRQVQDKQRANIDVPSWDNQALRLERLMQAVMDDS